jgi:hypothetical protein
MDALKAVIGDADGFTVFQELDQTRKAAMQLFKTKSRIHKNKLNYPIVWAR